MQLILLLLQTYVVCLNLMSLTPCSSFPSVLRHCWLGDRKGIQSVKKLGVGLLTVTI